MGLLDKYPIDLSAIQKGQLIDIPMLEQITSKRRDTDEFRFAVMGLQERINDRTSMTAKITTDGLRILTDSEASEYNQRQFGLSVGRTIRRHGKTVQVDVAQLSDDEKRSHDRRLLAQGRIVSAISKASMSRAVADPRHERRLSNGEKEPEPEAAKRP